ncbi:MAG: tetratricopeptide repeat protein [Hyphomicrobiaceae bacterium]
MGKVLGKSSAMGGAQRLATSAVTISMTLLLGACSQTGPLNLGLGLGNDQPATVDIATASAGNTSLADLEKATAYWGEQHSKNPRDTKAAVSYARNLKAMGRKANALAVLQATYMFDSDDKELLSEYGRLALDLGQVTTAEKLLARAEDPSKPDWKIVSARGTVLAKQGRFKESISYFEKALSLSPGRPSLLNNLAMAYAMDGEAARGEALLRQAGEAGSSDPRVQKNLELVMDLQGKNADTPPVPVPAATAAEPAATGVAARPPLSNSAWDKPLPIELAAAPVHVASTTNAASTALDADEIVRRAMAAEHGKAGQQR